MERVSVDSGPIYIGSGAGLTRFPVGLDRREKQKEGKVCFIFALMVRRFFALCFFSSHFTVRILFTSSLECPGVPNLCSADRPVRFL